MFLRTSFILLHILLVTTQRLMSGSTMPIDGAARTLKTLKSTVSEMIDLSLDDDDHASDDDIEVDFIEDKNTKTNGTPAASSENNKDPTSVDKAASSEDETTPLRSKNQKHLLMKDLNALVSQVFTDLRDQDILAQRITNSVNKLFTKRSATQPGFIDKIVANSVTFNDSIPTVKDIRSLNLAPPLGGDDEMDQATIDADVMYRGKNRNIFTF